MRRAAGLGLLCLAALLVVAQAQGPGYSKISAESLRAMVTYLASDELQGRDTPSDGLEKAADFIAEGFRKAGLRPLPGADRFFQRAEFVEITPGAGAEVVLSAQGASMALTPDAVRSSRAVELRDEAVYALPERLPDASLAGRVVAVVAGRFPSEESLDPIRALHPAAILLIGSRPVAQERSYLEEGSAQSSAVIRIVNEEALNALEDGVPLRVSIHIPEPGRRAVVLRNVVGIIPGTGKETVIVSAHYDHVGMEAGQVFNGANDDASGVASLIGIAGAMPGAPKRSIVFLAAFGEEKGLLGSQYYVEHPLVPLADTVAAINLEHLGRTDGYEGSKVAAFAFNGPSYSNLPGLVAEAARSEHVSVYRKPDGDTYFERSDNYSFAKAGIVAHTAMVLFEFPGYHQLTDKAGLLDYRNMQLVDRGLAAGIWAMANRAEKPSWSNRSETAAFRHAHR